LIVLVVVGLCAFAWWMQRDAYETGIAMGRQLERSEQYRREAVKRRTHLWRVK